MAFADSNPPAGRPRERAETRAGNDLSPERSDANAPASSELVRQFVAGRREAAGLIFDRHARTVRGVLLRALGPDQELEDLVHEVFVRFLTNPESLREPEKVSSYLFGIALRVASGELRRRRVRRRVRLTADGILPELPSFGTDSAVRRAIASLYRILDELDDERRLAFVLRFIENVSVADAARHLGVSEPTVKRWAARAWSHVAARAKADASLAGYVLPEPGGSA